MNKITRKYELLVTILILAFSLFMLINAFNTPLHQYIQGIKPMDFPIVILVSLLFLCLIIIVQNVLGTVKWEKIKKTKINKQMQDDNVKEIDKRVLITLALIILYAFFWNILGFLISSFLYFTVQSKVLDRRKSWFICSIISVIVTVFVYLVFGKLFSVQFPELLF